MQPLELMDLAEMWARDIHPNTYSSAQGRSYWRLDDDNDDVSVWAIRWADGFDSETGFHDHDISMAAIVVISGSVIEERLVLQDQPLKTSHRAGSAYLMDPSTIHSVRHDPSLSGSALTIHAYSPPLKNQGVYRRMADGSLGREVIPSTSKMMAHQLRENG